MHFRYIVMGNLPNSLSVFGAAEQAPNLYFFRKWGVGYPRLSFFFLAKKVVLKRKIFLISQPLITF